MNIEELKEIVAGATKGKWTLTENGKWPFDLEIVAVNAEKASASERIIISNRFAYGSSDKSLVDVMSGAAFTNGGREEAVRLNAEQLACHRLIAIAPELAARVIAADELVTNLKAMISLLQIKTNQEDIGAQWFIDNAKSTLSVYEAL